jgi:hypothetical protein
VSSLNSLFLKLNTCNYQAFFKKYTKKSSVKVMTHFVVSAPESVEQTLFKIHYSKLSIEAVSNSSFGNNYNKHLGGYCVTKTLNKFIKLTNCIVLHFLRTKKIYFLYRATQCND